MASKLEKNALQKKIKQSFSIRDGAQYDEAAQLRDEAAQRNTFLNRILVGRANAEKLFGILTDERITNHGRDKAISSLVVDSVSLVFLMNLAIEAKKKESTQIGARARAMLYDPPRKFINEEWTKNLGRPKTDQIKSKAQFAAAMLPITIESFKIELTARTIERDWLPKKSKK